mmetsp:Transcript_29857/g.71760  ORF Transcript_29857/g.71760 Transcript_29857/m.71760 type:complete len:87 (-) Transcript_29857:23-283(-)
MHEMCAARVLLLTKLMGKTESDHDVMVQELYLLPSQFTRVNHQPILPMHQQKYKMANDKARAKAYYHMKQQNDSTLDPRRYNTLDS